MKKDNAPLTAEQIAEQIAIKNSQQQSGKRTVYPQAALSDKQLEALQSVIKTDNDREEEETPVINDAENESKKSRKRKAKKRKSNEIKGGSPVKTVFGILFALILVGGAGFAGLYYWWTNHATFDYTLQPIVILEGQNIKADDFLAPGENINGVHAELQNPDFEPETELHFVPVKLSLGLRSLETEAILFVLTPIESIVHEFAEEAAALRPGIFIANARAAADVEYDVKFIEEPQPLESYPVGEHTLHLALNDVPFEVTLIVEDTTAPTATPTYHTILIGESVTTDDFVKDIFDASPIASVEFLEEPDVFARGEDQTVRVEIQDIYGNTAVFPALLTIELNQLTPEIHGVVEMIESEVNKPVNYSLENVVAFDDFGRPMEVAVNDLHVDENTPGIYIAVFWAEDYTGLITEIEVPVFILTVNPEAVYEQVDTILSGIINTSMSQEEKAVAIHNWVRSNFSKSTTGVESESNSSLEIAGTVLPRGRRTGTSQVYAAVSEVLLTRAGIPVRRIERTEDADSEHHWLLINPDDKGWHHFDPFPTGLVLGNLTAMFTEEDADDIARRVKAQYRTEDYYKYDASLHPDIVKE